jgi:Protein of unknown function (DUF3285)
MTEPTSPQPASGANTGAQPAGGPNTGENPSFTKLAMRNMVRKGRQSLVHFGLTAAGFLGFITLIAWLGRPQLPGG